MSRRIAHHALSSNIHAANREKNGHNAVTEIAMKPAARRKGILRPAPVIIVPHHGDHTTLVLHRTRSARWEWIELLRDSHPHMAQQSFHARGLHRSRDIVESFGIDAPPSSDALLHYAGDPPLRSEWQAVPILLVHGANANADFWLDPMGNGSGRSLPQFLRSQGFQVYAVTFAHSQDDNYLWAQQVANAVRRIRQITGSSKVDLLGHSKGGVPVRCYASDFREPWMTPYQGDVRRLILMAAPNGGIDFSFRHPVSNYALHEGGSSHLLNAPMSWDGIIRYGIMQDCRAMGPGKDGPDYWPGQRQLLARWDDRYPLPILDLDVKSTYEGGRGLVSESRGIDHFIEEGGDFMRKLDCTPIDSNVEVIVLAGNKPDIPGILNENTGPSDGLLFVESALAVPEGTQVVAQDVMPFNHMNIISSERPQSWLNGVLKSEKRNPLSPEELLEIKKRGLGCEDGSHFRPDD
jgi:triacylglycerol lipase